MCCRKPEHRMPIKVCWRLSFAFSLELKRLGFAIKVYGFIFGAPDASCVCVAAMLKRHLNYSPNGFELYHGGGDQLLPETNSLRSSNNGMNEAVNYRPISPKDLAKSVLSEGGWSNLMCSGENSQQPVDIALVFVGRELQSSDLSSNEHVDPALLDLLKFFTALKQVSFTRSNFSIAFPYVVASEVEETIENSLLSGFTESCGRRLGVRDIALLGSCSVEGEDFKKLADLHSVHDYLVSRMENKSKGQVDLILYCHGGTHSLKKLDQIPSEDFLWAYQFCGAVWGKVHSSLYFRSLLVNSILLPGTWKVSC